MKAAFFSLIAGLFVAGLAAGADTGKILILDNELLVEGDIRHEKDHYIVRRGKGETIFPANRVIELVADRSEAFHVLRERANLRDYDERMHLVRWCMENGLHQEAVAEGELLLKFRPDDSQLRLLVEGLRSLIPAHSAPVVSKRPPTAKLPDKIIEVEPLDYNRESFGLFVAKVQPILMNACASCHAGGQGGNFTLINVAAGSNRKASLFNLTSTLKQLKRSDFSASPLLVKAVTPHGETAARPPLRDRQSPAYQYLESWVAAAITPEEAPAPAPVEVPKPLPVVESKSPAGKTLFGETSTSKPGPEPQTEPKDPFDPAIFNGTIQPKDR